MLRMRGEEWPIRKEVGSQQSKVERENSERIWGGANGQNATRKTGVEHPAFGKGSVFLVVSPAPSRNPPEFRPLTCPSAGPNICAKWPIPTH